MLVHQYDLFVLLKESYRKHSYVLKIDFSFESKNSSWKWINRMVSVDVCRQQDACTNSISVKIEMYSFIWSTLQTALIPAPWGILKGVKVPSSYGIDMKIGAKAFLQQTRLMNAYFNIPSEAMASDKEEDWLVQIIISSIVTNHHLSRQLQACDSFKLKESSSVNTREF